jgi:imidazolonepropionase-like amidohydrolase
MRCAALLLVGLAACGCAADPAASRPTPSVPTPSPPPSADAGGAPGRILLINARAPGGAPRALALDGATIRTSSAALTPQPGERVVDLGGRFLVPAFIDAHVHLAYLPEATAMARGGVAGVLDLAAPLSYAASRAQPLQLAWSGPMITAVGGYPTRDWGSDGYGLECATASEAADAVDLLAARGARVIKVPITGLPTLDDGALAAITTRAHARGLRVVAHALRQEDVRRAIRADVDILAHTPLEPLSDEVIALFGARTVISTLSAFGGSALTVDNLRRLRRGGAQVWYGTDFGNTRMPGIQAEELRLLEAAGLDGRAIVEAATRAPAAALGFTELGQLEPGHRASFLVVDEDPYLRPATLTQPHAVWIDGASD